MAEWPLARRFDEALVYATHLHEGTFRKETSIPYVIEKDLGTTATELWIKVPVLPVGTSRILLHHGNAAAVGACLAGQPANHRG